MRVKDKNVAYSRKAETSLNGLPGTPASPDQEDTDADDDESVYEVDGGEE